MWKTSTPKGISFMVDMDGDSKDFTTLWHDVRITFITGIEQVIAGLSTTLSLKNYNATQLG